MAEPIQIFYTIVDAECNNQYLFGKKLREFLTLVPEEKTIVLDYHYLPDYIREMFVFAALNEETPVSEYLINLRVGKLKTLLQDEDFCIYNHARENKTQQARQYQTQAILLEMIQQYGDSQ